MRLDTGASRVVLRADIVGRFALDAAADTLLVAVAADGREGPPTAGSRDGVVFVPLTAAAPATSRVQIDDVEDLVVCAGRRYALSSVANNRVALHDLTTVAAGVTLDAAPPLPATSPMASVQSMNVRRARLSCASDTLAVTTDDAVLLLPNVREPAAAFVRVPIVMQHDNDTLRTVLPLPNGDLLTWSNRGLLRVLDRAGKTKAVRGVDASNIALAGAPLGSRVIAGDASFALPLLNDRVQLGGPPGTTVALDAQRVLTLLGTGLRERAVAPSPSPADLRTLHQPSAIARRLDGRRFAVGQKDGTIVVFDRTQSGGPLIPVATLRAHRHGLDGVVALAFLSAKDAGAPRDVLVSVGDDDVVHVFEEPASNSGWRLLRSVVVRESGARGSVAFDAGRGLVAVAGSEVVSVVDLRRGEVTRVLGPLPREQSFGIRSPAFSPDGTQLAFVDDARRVRVYSLTDGREDRGFAGTHDAVTYDNQGRLLRITRDKAILEGSSATARARELPVPAWSADNIVRDPASSEVWLSSWNGWFAVLGQPEGELRQGPWHVADLLLDGDRVITIGPDEQISSWPRHPATPAVDTARVLFGVRNSGVASMAFVGELVAVAMESGQLRLFGKEAGAGGRALRRATCSQRGDDGAPYEATIVPDVLATRTLRSDGKEAEHLVGVDLNGAVRWNLATGAVVCLTHSFDARVRFAGLTGDGRVVWVSTPEGALWVGDKRREIAPRESVADEAVLVGDDDRSLAAVYVDDEGTHAVRVSDGAALGSTRGANVAALPGGRVLLGRWPTDTPKDDEEERLAIAAWTPGRGPPRLITREHPFTNDLLASPDGARFLQSMDAEVWLRDTNTGAVQAVVDAIHVEALAFSADGTRFAVSAGGIVAVYDLEGRDLWRKDARLDGAASPVRPR